MSDSKKTYVPPEILKLMNLGKVGKLWTIEVIYTLDSVVHRYRKVNQESKDIMKLRENIFTVGLLVPVDAGHWKIVCPIDFISVDLWKQDNYFPEA